MNTALSANRTATHLLAITTVALAMAACHPAWGGIGGRELVVTLRLPSETSPAETRAAAEAEILRGVSCGADGLMFIVRRMTGETMELIGGLSLLATKHNVKLWIAAQQPDENLPDLARATASQPVEGLALLFAPPKGEPADPANLAALLTVKRRGDELGRSFREVKSLLGSRKKLALCTTMSEIAPETARSQYVPVGDLVRDGTVDVVGLGEAERLNFHRLRLLRDTPLRAGNFLDANSVDEKRRAGLISRAVLDTIQNDTSQLLWLHDFPAGLVGQVAPAAVEGFRKSQEQRAAFEAALAKGEMVIDQEVLEKGVNDQATLHGVAQSFVPSRDGFCALVQIFAAIRGSQGPLPPPIHVEIREDDAGKPGTAALAESEIPAAEFGLEPAYRWGSAQWAPPLPLKKGHTYWICLTNKQHPDGNYVWRIAKDAAGPRGRAWSSRYDYSKHAWVFRVYLKKEPSP